MAIALDLKTGLPKVRRSFKKLSANVGKCSYQTPCAIGAMMTPAQRRGLLDVDKSTIGRLIMDRRVVLASGQACDFRDLQYAFDGGSEAEFTRTVERLERKYLGKQVSA